MNTDSERVAQSVYHSALCVLSMIFDLRGWGCSDCVSSRALLMLLVSF